MSYRYFIGAIDTFDLGLLTMAPLLLFGVASVGAWLFWRRNRDDQGGVHPPR
jgi:hypothetical protein